MVEVLIAGKLRGAPEAKRSASGKQYVRFRVSVPTADGDSILASVVAFADAAARVEALSDGDAVSIAGSAKLTHWTGKEGEIRVGLDVVASAILTAYAVRKRRGEAGGSGTRAATFERG